jgi:hypothetical protein
VGLLQRRYAGAGEHPVDPVELGLVRYALQRIRTLKDVQVVLQLTPPEARRRFACNIPSVEEVESRMANRAEGRVTVPYYRPYPSLSSAFILPLSMTMIMV